MENQSNGGINGENNNKNIMNEFYLSIIYFCKSFVIFHKVVDPL